MEPNEDRLIALDEAFEVLCKTGDPTEWISNMNIAKRKKLEGMCCMKVGIVGASINVDNEQIVKAASDLGEWLSKNNHTIVYSRNAIGLVSVVLNAVEQEGGKSIQLDSISIDDMLSEVDAIIFLPGGIDVFHSGIHLFNLCEEGVFMKPFLLLNIDGFWTPLTHMLTRMKSDQFLANLPDNVCFCDSIESIAKTIKQEIEG